MRILLIMIVMFVVSGCISDCDDLPEEPGWKKFEGLYYVTKLESGETYNLRISFDSLLLVGTENQFDIHIIYGNFDNAFDSLTSQYPNGTPDDETRIKNFTAPFGITDYQENRWSLSMLSQDTLTPELENTLVNDTILFYFRKSNIAFYAEDGVPYYDCYCKHLAVKVE